MVFLYPYISDMTKVRDIAQLIESIAPLQLQESYDNAGLQLGNPEQEVTGVLFCLDIDEHTVAEAHALGAQLVVSHHPLIFRGIKKIDPTRDYISRTIVDAIRADISLYSAHTNLDNAPRGVNYHIAQLLGLTDVMPLAPLSDAQQAGLHSAEACGSGVVGNLPEAMSCEELAQRIKSTFRCADVSFTDIHRPIRRLALCGGAGADFISDAIRKQADAFFTGELRYHEFFGHPDLMLIETGHYESEQFTTTLLCDLVSQHFPELSCHCTQHPANPVKHL